MNPEPQAPETAEDAPVHTAHAPWLSIPEVVSHVDELRRTYSDPSMDVAHVLCDRHPRENTAFLLVDGDVTATELSFGQLQDESKRLAASLHSRGVRAGDRVAVLLGKRRELPISLLAIWRLGAVYVPLFTAFAGPAVEMRVRDAQAVLIITEPGQRHKADGLGIDVLETGADFDALASGEALFAPNVAVGGEAPIIQLYTSGTTGTPKAVGVPARAIASFISYMHYGLDVVESDVHWNAADPGWAYGLYFGIVGPLATGQANILLQAGFSAELTERVITQLGVTNFAAAPTVYRSLKANGTHLTTPLRRASSAGEPLTPDVTSWAPEALGCIVRDQFGQTEQGMVIVNAWHPLLQSEHTPGSMGQALPGYVAGTVGRHIALSVRDSPLMWFTGYVDAPEKTRERFTADGSWYYTGDVGHQDGGDFFFASRDDDVILAAGYRIGPFDIESIITQHADVAEVAVVGRPDELRGEVVEAFVVLANDAAGTDALRISLQQLVRNHYGAHAYPRRIHFVGELPKTPSGKVQRFLLRRPDYLQATQ
ncbi:AMP-binding protein [Paenarthrobacter ureafaciens]|uniref:AMP-binding protein n=1 Tax=Paenarthrobacter ureafaciens TaxID=37931 RepID=UPI002119A8A0|nr:AMP-binding protein [Paenarthrobacter ureafaciens]MEC3854106.1 AMP-binding protein [Paenarthrobacter ureafaciens]